MGWWEDLQAGIGNAWQSTQQAASTMDVGDWIGLGVDVATMNVPGAVNRVSGAFSEAEQRKKAEEIAQPYTVQGEKTLAESQAAQQAAQAGFAPYTGAGQAALQQQQALAGLLGPEAQRQAISMVESSPQYQAMMQQGERAIMQNAAATGGLRGGNVQEALAQFRPQLLSSLIEQQYGRLGGLSAAGLQAASQGGQLGYQYSELGGRTRGEMAAAQAGVPLAQLQMMREKEARRQQEYQQGRAMAAKLTFGTLGALAGGPAGAAVGTSVGDSATTSAKTPVNTSQAPNPLP